MSKFVLLIILSIFLPKITWAHIDFIEVTVANPALDTYVYITSTYQANSNDRVCTELVRDGAGFKRIPIRLYNIPATYISDDASVLRADQELNGVYLGESDQCTFERLSTSLSVTTDVFSESYNVVSIYDNNKGSGTQDIECHKTDLGSHGKMVACYNDISLDKDKKAKINVVWTN